MVRFWDSSALAPLVMEEPRSHACRRLLKDRSGVAVWAFTRTEMTSAVWQRARMSALPSATVMKALNRIEALSRGWSEIIDLEQVRDRAERLLGSHDLRAADALQLAAALVLTRDRPRGHDFVTADGALGRAAAAEGFNVLIQK
jgi:predicted nucleic acid-binding protein